MIYYTLNFWAQGRWGYAGANDKFLLYFDGTIIEGLRLLENSFPSDLCGGASLKDLRDLKIFGMVNHSSSALDYRIISKVNEQNNRLFGFREVTFLFNIGPIQSNFICGKAPISLPDPSMECQCIEGKYFNGDLHLHVRIVIQLVLLVLDLDLIIVLFARS